MRETVMGNEKTKAVYDRLCEQFTQAHGEVSPAADALILKAAYLEGLHDDAVAALNKDGLREKYPVSNYRTGTRENKALGMLLKIEGQQAKLLRDLKLLPGARGAPKEEPEDEADDIDNY